MFSFLQSLGLYKFLYFNKILGGQFKLNLSCIGEGLPINGATLSRLPVKTNI